MKSDRNISFYTYLSQVSSLYNKNFQIKLSKCLVAPLYSLMLTMGRWESSADFR